MKPLMKAIDTPDQVFHDGDPSTGELGTICSAEWLNDTQGSVRDIQSECIAILRANGFEPDASKSDQLWEAIQTAIKSQVPAATLTTAGISLLSSSVTSNNESIAATSKAVKIAMDNANARLAKERNLADLPSIPLALANLTLADVKKYVESTNTGVSKLPQFRPSSEGDLTSLPAGYMALAKNSTPGGPLPDENWFYLEVAGKLDNLSNNPNRKGAVIRLTQVSNPGISWTGAKFDDGTTTTAKFTWAKDFNTLNKPTPEDVGLAATKKAVDDTQIGLAAQGVMWITSADDLSNLPSGARRFASNKAPATVLPAAGYFFLEVLAKRDTANGSCILATSNTGDVWMGLRYTVPNDAAFTWIQLNQNVENLGLTETVNRASHVSTDGNLNGSLWGGWLNSWLNTQFAARDNNINTRATWDWVNQHFVQDVRLAAPVEFSERGLTERVWGGVVTSWADYGGSNYHIKWRLLQKLINGQWLTVAYA